MKKFLVPALLFSASLFAYEPEDLSQTYQKCVIASDGATQKLISCANEESNFQKKEMQEHYQLLLKRLTSTEKKKKLEDSQKKWDAFVKAKCEFHDGISGQIWDNINKAQCFMEEAYLRSQELKLIADRLKK